MSLPQDTTEIQLLGKKTPFWHNLASPRRERSSQPSPQQHQRFRALAPNQYLLNRTKPHQQQLQQPGSDWTTESQLRHGESLSQQEQQQQQRLTSSRTRGFRRREAVIDQSPLGISATNYRVPEDYKGAPSRLLVTNTEQEVIFYDKHNQENDDDCLSLFDGAWENNSSFAESDNSCNCSLDVPPPSPSSPHSAKHSLSNSETEDDGNNDKKHESSDSSNNSSNLAKPAAVKIMDPVVTPRPVAKKSGLALFSRNKSDTKRKAKEIVEHRHDRDSRNKSSDTATPVKENHSAVNIFLLLLETETKMFELIQVGLVCENWSNKNEGISPINFIFCLVIAAIPTQKHNS